MFNRWSFNEIKTALLNNPLTKKGWWKMEYILRVAYDSFIPTPSGGGTVIDMGQAKKEFDASDDEEAIRKARKILAMHIPFYDISGSAVFKKIVDQEGKITEIVIKKSASWGCS